MSDPLSSDLASLKIDRSAPAPRAASRRVPVAPFVFLFFVAALAGAAYLAWPHLEARVFKTKVRLTEVARVSPSQASTTLSSTGYVVPRVVSRIGSPIIGRIVRVPVREGDRVRVGDLLAELDPDDAERAVAAARSRLLAAQARAATAQAQLVEVQQQAARQRTLFERGVAARSTVEDLDARAVALEAQANASSAEARAARSEVEVARASAERTRIVAQIDGTVITEAPNVGDMAWPERELMQVADMSSLVVETDVPETRLSLVRIGGPCEIVLDAFPGRRFRGEALEIGRRVDRARATVTVRVRFTDPTDDVLADMAARVSFLSEALTDEQLRATSRVVVPAEAVTSRGGDRVVFVFDEGVARMQRVRLGARSDDGFLLIEGPEPGTKLVARPPATMADGQRIEERTD